MPHSNDLQKLHQWFLKEARSLPWRKPLSATSTLRDPYRVWVSEIMLQQTQVVTVIPYFEKWMQRWPTLQRLAEAPEVDVLDAWEGLGYYSRARNIQATAKYISQDLQGNFPENRNEIEALKGVGPYTAGAILSLAYNQAEAILDGNLIRVFSRYYTLMGDPKSSQNQKTLWQYADLWVKTQSTQAQITNESLMELGAKICSPKNPQCPICPLSTSCLALQEGEVEYWPRPTPKQEKIIWRGVAVWVQDQDKTLVVKGKEQPFLKSTLCLPLLHLPTSFNSELSIRHNITKYNIQLSILKLDLKQFEEICLQNEIPFPSTQKWVRTPSWESHVTSSLAPKLNSLMKQNP
jgi:A/G-specific adenine glycosylase